MRALILVLFLTSWVNPLVFSQSATEASGLIIPRDIDGMYVRNQEGQFEVTWTSNTKVALVVNTRLLGGLKGDRLTYKIHSSKEVVTYSVPKGPITGIKTTRGGKIFQRDLQAAEKEKWLSENDLNLYFNEKPVREQLGTKDDPRFIGTWDPTTKPRTLSINGAKYEISMKKGGQASVLLYNLLSVKDCKPFINEATVIGRQKGDVLIAEEIHLQPIGDQAALDDPKLPITFLSVIRFPETMTRGYGKPLLESLICIIRPPTVAPLAKARRALPAGLVPMTSRVAIGM